GKKIIKAVGDPEMRFQEDALRLMRAVRFMAQLGFKIEDETEEAIKKQAGLLEFISHERIRDEISKTLMTERAAEGIDKMHELGILKYAIPELMEGVGVSQNHHHIFTVFEHNLKSLDYAAKKDLSLEIRLASLLHDVGKPKSKRGEGLDATFYGHQVIGARMAAQILDRLKFSKEIIENVVLLIREHMFVYDPETVTDAGARRLLRRVGAENMDDLFSLREADRIGSGVPKAQPYRLRHLKFRIEKVSKDPISAKMLQLDGSDLMKDLNMIPGPRIGFILAILLEEVLDDPTINSKEILLEKARTLNVLDDKQLAEMSKFAKKSANEAQTDIE
ncbi:MAG: HD domain-containing protein, partial [Patescibacteria group bacterium]